MIAALRGFWGFDLGLTPSWIVSPPYYRSVVSLPSSTIRSGPPPEPQSRALLVHNQYSCSVSAFKANTAVLLRAMAAIGDVGEMVFLQHILHAEEEFAKTGKVPNPSSTTNVEFQIVLELIKKSLKVDPLRYHKMKDRVVGMSKGMSVAIDCWTQSVDGIENAQEKKQGSRA